jgi:MFS family permease
MSKIITRLGRKTLSLALIFNSMISLASIVNILVGSYINAYSWQLYSVYLVNGSLFLFAIATAVLNIVPAKFIGKVHLKRILFHHYVYGFLASSISLMLMAIFAPAYVLVFLMPSLGFQTTGMQMITIYSCLFFVYGGLTLMIDDIQDVSMRLDKTLDRLKIWAIKSSKTLQKVHFISSLATVYIATYICALCLENVATIETGSPWFVSNMILAASLFITGFWGLKAVKAKYWFTKLYSDLSKAETMMYKQYEA